jgi:hypothetical protein
MGTRRPLAFLFSKNWQFYFLLALGLCVGFAAIAHAQLATATINGTVKDTTGAVIPAATVVLQDVATGVKRVVTTNGAGVYVIPDIRPGRYTLQVSKQGFITARQADFSLFVNQTATFDFTLRVGSTTQTVSVVATAAHLEASTAEIGTVINTSDVNDLPLNGRNFTELLTLTPGVSPISTAQNAGGGGQWAGQAIGSFTFPSVNGQTNRSNLFYLDGINDEGSFISSYATPPIVDDIQEFKVQSHNDLAEYGQTLGGIINVATKSGTNEFHGDAWEFVRNDAFDARNPFLATVPPFKQNQFGGTVGGPVIFPHYNGKDKTFFFAAYEGFRNHTSAQSLYTVPTPAELAGDFSAVPAQIYNPFSTRPDPARPGEFIRDPFLNNQIPAKLLNSSMVGYAKAVFPSPVATNIPGINGIDTTPTITRQDVASMRIDEQMNERNQLWARYSGYTQPDSSSGGFVGAYDDAFIHGYNVAANYTHTFSGTMVMDAEFGRNSDQGNIFRNITAPANLWQQLGFSPNFASNFVGNRSWLPGVSIPGYLGWLPGIQFSTLSNIYEARGDLSIVHGRHTLKMGADFNSNNTLAPIEYNQVNFSSFQTSNPEAATGIATGNALASFVLNVPDNANRRNVLESEHGGWVDGLYFQDQWKATNKLMFNMGVRYDVTLIPIYGTGTNAMVGDLDLKNGTYIVAKMAPPCSATQGAPCIPGGTLPAHVVLTPFKNGAIYHNTYDNIQPRVGLAYRFGPTTVLRASYGRFFDNWAAIIQTAQNYEGAWPSVGQLINQNLNNPTPANPTPTTSALDPFHSGTTQLFPAATPFNQVQWFMNPTFQNPESDQWNLGVQQQLGANTVLTANYVGSLSRRTDVGGFNNVAVMPGPGNPQSRAPYPYITPTFYDDSVGSANYNAFQFSLNKVTSKGLTYLVSYTWSKAMDYGSDGWYGAEGTLIQNPYNRRNAYSVAGFDLTHMLSASAVYQLPFGRGKKFQSGNRALNAVLGSWQLNGIVTLDSGQPYSITSPAGSANTGNIWLMANLVGNPALSRPTPSEWFNRSAFAVPPPFTFGTAGRNILRSDWFHNVDLSLFREFPISESKKLEFRFETFNAFNNPTWGIPDSGITDPTFGQVFGTANIPRQLQFALKFYF